MEAQSTEKIKQMSIMATELKNVMVSSKAEEKELIDKLEEPMYVHMVSCEDLKSILSPENEAVVNIGGAIIELENDGLFHSYLTVSERKNDSVSSMVLQLATENLCLLLKEKEVAKEIKVKNFIICVSSSTSTEATTRYSAAMLIALQHENNKANLVVIHRQTADDLIFTDTGDRKDKKKKKKGKKGKH